MGKVTRISLSGIKPVKRSTGPVCVSNSKQEEKWRAESDARCMAEAASIYADPERARKARGAAARIVREQEANLSNLRAITKKGAR